MVSLKKKERLERLASLDVLICDEASRQLRWQYWRRAPAAAQPRNSRRPGLPPRPAAACAAAPTSTAFCGCAHYS